MQIFGGSMRLRTASLCLALLLSSVTIIGAPAAATAAPVRLPYTISSYYNWAKFPKLCKPGDCSGGTSSGTAVRLWQNILWLTYKDLFPERFTGNFVDGQFGENTKFMTRVYQTDHPDTRGVDGIVGPNTWSSAWGSVWYAAVPAANVPTLFQFVFENRGFPLIFTGAPPPGQPNVSQFYWIGTWNFDTYSYNQW